MSITNSSPVSETAPSRSFAITHTHPANPKMHIYKAIPRRLLIWFQQNISFPNSRERKRVL